MITGMLRYSCDVPGCGNSVESRSAPRGWVGIHGGDACRRCAPAAMVGNGLFQIGVALQHCIESGSDWVWRFIYARNSFTAACCHEERQAAFDRMDL